MKKTFLDDLPKLNNGYIDWKNSAGHFIPFIYDDIKGQLEILEYKDYNNILVKYKDIERITDIRVIKNGRIGCCIGQVKERAKTFKYNIGEILEQESSTIEILEQITKQKYRAYRYRCKCCGAIDEIRETSIDKGSGCAVCGHRKVIKGINDIATTNPEVIFCLKNKEDGYKYSAGSSKKIWVVCSDCGAEKLMIVSNLVKRGFSCNRCGDGISYSEKFLYNLLTQLGIKFKMHKLFEWSKKPNIEENKIYDFYFEYNNEPYIIEAMGIQHYEKGFDTCGGRTLKEEQENDVFKEKLAYDNGIKNYIKLDCRKSTLDWIKKSILQSQLALDFDLSNIDWVECVKYTTTSKVIEACELWKEFRHTKKIKEKMGIDDTSTIIKWLKQGVEVGICDYNPEISKRNKIVTVIREGVHVICNETKLWFISAKKAGDYYGISRGAVANCAKGLSKKTIIKNSDGTITYLTWSYYNEDYIKEHGEGIFIDN